MKRFFLFIVLIVLFQTQLNAQCDSIYVTNIEIPQTDDDNIFVSINNTSSTHHIYLNLILIDDLTNQVIAETDGGYLQLYPNQINTYEVDTVPFSPWQLHYNLIDIPSIDNISVHFQGLCEPIPWENTLSSAESNHDLGLHIYPNPTTSQLIIEGQHSNSFRIYNVLGKVVMNSKSASNNIIVDGLSEGVYFLEFENSSSIYKFIKE